MSTATQQRLMTGEEFVAEYGHRHAELVDGIVKEEVPVPNLRHGEVCAEFARLLGNFAKDNKLGRVMSNDSNIRVKRNPDTVRGPDVCFFSFAVIPPGPAPDALTDLVPELAVEVRSPTNTWNKIFSKVGEYLTAGVRAVAVLDPETASVSVYRADEFQQIFHAGDELTLPDVLPGFAVPVRRFFE